VIQYTEEEFQEGMHILFSAHGVPQSYIQAGDPYQRQIEECVCLISKEIAKQIADPSTRPKSISEKQADFLLGIDSANTMKIHLSFQSRVGPVQWLQPYTETMLEDLGHAGVKNLIVVPISFVSEHIETLEEIDMEYQELAIESGIKKWRRVPALNTDALFIKDMADMVEEALESPSLSLSEVAGQEVEQLGGGGGGGGNKMGIPIEAEMIPGRVAMLGIVGTSLIEFLNGTPILKLVGLK
jgi:ferrochelatase